MTFIEIFVPRGVLSPERRRHLGEHMIDIVIGGEGMVEEHVSAPAAVMETALSLAQVVVHEPDAWVTGGLPNEHSTAPCYVVRVTLPGAWRKEMSEHVITGVTRALAKFEDDPEAIFRESRLWVQVVGVPEGGYGTRGQAMTSPDLVRMITDPWRGSPDAQQAGADLPPGMALDPVCGMTVPLASATFTLEHEGTTHAFCSAGCRQVFAADLRAATATG